MLAVIASQLLSLLFTPTAQQYLLIKSFSLLLLGMFLSTLATLNFSLAFLIGLFTAPLSFTPLPGHDRPGQAKRIKGLAAFAGLSLLNPQVVMFGWCYFGGHGLGDVLIKAAFGWHVWRMWTPVVVWCIWWPAWYVAQLLMLSPD